MSKYTDIDSHWMVTGDSRIVVSLNGQVHAPVSPQDIAVRLDHVEALEAEIEELQAENTRLRAELKELKRDKTK